MESENNFPLELGDVTILEGVHQIISHIDIKYLAAIGSSKVRFKGDPGYSHPSVALKWMRQKWAFIKANAKKFPLSTQIKEEDFKLQGVNR